MTDAEIDALAREILTNTVHEVLDWDSEFFYTVLRLPDGELIPVYGATPYIPFKTNVTGKRGSELWLKLFHYYSFKREEFLIHYHQRSNVETTFSMIKAKFGERLRSKTETAQVNEALCKVLCHNLCVVIQSMYELGIAPEFTSEAA
jgi:transposase